MQMMCFLSASAIEFKFCVQKHRSDYIITANAAIGLDISSVRIVVSHAHLH